MVCNYTLNISLYRVSLCIMLLVIKTCLQVSCTATTLCTNQSVCPQLSLVIHGVCVPQTESVRTSLGTGYATEIVWSPHVSETALIAGRTGAPASKRPSLSQPSIFLV